MKKMNFVVVFIISLAFIQCEKEEEYIKTLITGNWQLIEITLVSDNKELGWNPVGDYNQKIEFQSDDKYYLIRDDTVLICTGKYEFKSVRSIKLVPQDCHSLIRESIETIYKLTEDTLILSNAYLFTYSMGGRRDKFIKK